MRSIALLISFLCSLNFSFTQVEEGRRITKELCSERYFGRGYVKGGDSLAAEFLAAEFERHGIKPIGDSYFQAFKFDVNTFPGKMTLELDSVTLIPGKDFMVDPASGPSKLTWNYKYLSKEDLFSEKVMAEFLYQLRSTRDWNSLVIDTRGITGDSLKEVKGFQKGLAQACHVISVTDEKFTFSVSQQQLKHAFIHVKGRAFEKGAAIKSEIEAVVKKQHEARNVIAKLPAKRRTKNTLMLTAHYDHLGAMGSETYFPGGNDNASGTSMLYALADIFKKKRLKYNVVFVAFAGEEAGLIGSKYFVENSPISLRRIRFLLNIDIMGSGEDGITVVNGSLHKKQFDRLKKINKRKQYLSKIRIRGKAANSDHYWFSEKGVPAFFIYTHGPNKHYHDVFDTYEALSFAKYNDLVKLTSEFLLNF